MSSPARSRTLKTFSKIMALVLMSVGFLWLLKLAGVLNLNLCLAAFQNKNAGFALAVLTLALLPALGAVRSYILLKKISVVTKFSHVLSAGFISQAMGQWMPGSMMVIEVIRFGLVTGMSRHRPNADDMNERDELPARVGIAFLLDRILGLGAMFITGAFCAAILYVKRDPLIKHSSPLIAMAAISFCTGALLLMAPIWVRCRLLHKFLAGMGADSILRNRAGRRGGPFGRILQTVRVGMNALGEASMTWRDLRLPLFISFALAVLNPLTLYSAAWAMGRPLPILAIITAIPFTLLAILLPLGIAGFGGQQAMAVGAFSVFNLSPETVVAASLVQNALALIVYTVCGGIAAGIVSRKLSEIFKERLGRNQRHKQERAQPDGGAGRPE
jgi:uncharacterized membrane protein YbhN (UPF0104 family)